jgi:hypothetical protein
MVNYDMPIGLILAIVAAVFIFVVIVINVFPLACPLKLMTNSAIRISLKTFFIGIPSFLTNALGGFFGNNFFGIQNGWQACIFSFENPTTTDTVKTISDDSMLCWNIFGSGKKDYLELEPPVIDCFKNNYKFSDGKELDVLDIATRIWQIASGPDSDTKKAFNDSGIKIVFVKPGPNDEAELIDFDSSLPLNKDTTITISFLDWQTITRSGTDSELKKQCYISFFNRYEIAQAYNQITFPINASTTKQDWENCDRGVCVSLFLGVQCMDDPDPISNAATCVLLGGVYDHQGDDICDLAYSSCGYLRNSIACCEDKIIVCVNEGEGS